MSNNVIYLIKDKRDDLMWEKLYAKWEEKKVEWFEDTIKFHEYEMNFYRGKAKWEKMPEAYPSYSKADVEELEKGMEEWAKQIKDREWVDSIMVERFGYSGLKQKMRELKNSFEKLKKLSSSVLGVQPPKRPKLRLISRGKRAGRTES